MKAKKLKVYVKTEKYAIPLPALRFSTLRWLVKVILRWLPQKYEKGNVKAEILNKLSGEDIAKIIDIIAQEEPFELVDIEAFDENAGKVVIKIFTK